MGIAKFGEVDGMGIDLVEIASDDISAGILTYGATLQYLKVPAKNGEIVDVVLGYDTAEDYATHSGRMGATIGRFANRIANGCFCIKGN